MSDSGLISLLAAAINDQETHKRIVQLNEAKAATDASAEAAARAIEENQALLAEIQTERRAAEAASAGVAEREAKLNADTAALIEHINKFEANKLAWEQGRVADEAAYTEKHTKLTADALAHNDAVAAHRTKEAELNGRVSTIVQREARVARQQAAMQAALDVK